MEVAGAVVGILANAFTLGRELTTLYQSLTDARSEIAERTAYMRCHWNRTKVQLEIIERIWTSLSEDHQAVQMETLNVLIIKLKSARDKLNGLLKKRTRPERTDDERPAVKRWKYYFLKCYLDDTIKSLDRWQRMYDPSWYLILRVASPLIDTELKREDTARPTEGSAILDTAIRIRENLIGFGDSKLGSFFLVGFDQVRSADGMTYFRGDVDWQKNLHRHPERQGLVPEEKYCMQHDIYSLGVCLLEIGLWQSFVIYGEDGKVRSPNAALLGLSIEELRRKSPAAVKDLLVDLARRHLPSMMGGLYEEVVVNCLTCLDAGNVEFGDASEFEDSDGVTVGVRYIEKVLLKLNSISV
ncbi:hypothetical protein LTR85_001020 [Meristemomyces frigidus]|nr:hypothetical protein LTR85_001020 [Meristemomyces frigidus]